MKKQKIALYIDSMQKGGANRVMANLSDFFVNQGYEVILINDIEPRKGIPEYSVNGLVKRFFIGGNSGSRIITNITRLLNLRKVIKEEQPDSVVSFMGPPNFRMLIGTIGLQCRKIVSVRNDPNIEYGRSALRKIMAGWIFQLSDGCVFQTEEAASYFPNSVRKKSKIIFNPVNELFYATNQIEHPHDIITVGRLEPQKNHKLLMKAYSMLPKQYREDKLIIYGEGSLRDELTAYARELDIENDVLLPGISDKVYQVLSRAKCFVLSSDYEGMPNALMEAMAVGIPVISTDCPCGGPRALLRDKEDGLIVPCNDPERLAEAMLSILKDKEIRKMGEAAKNRAGIFSKELVLKQWEQFVYLQGDTQ